MEGTAAMVVAVGATPTVQKAVNVLVELVLLSVSRPVPVTNAVLPVTVATPAPILESRVAGGWGSVTLFAVAVGVRRIGSGRSAGWRSSLGSVQ